MINLKEIDQSNFNDCISLERKSHKYVGDATYVLAEAYTYRHHSTAYGIYDDDIIVGLVILRDRPINQNYSFTDLFIADNHQCKGYAKEAVKKIIEKFKDENEVRVIDLFVHETNDVAIKIYKDYGFKEIEIAKWDSSFIKFSMDI